MQKALKENLKHLCLQPKYKCLMLNTTVMMQYAKIILPKVCAWDDLFKKELLKCASWTGKSEKDELIEWCFNNFGRMHPVILEEVFNTSSYVRNVRKTSPRVGGNPYKIQIKHRSATQVA
jgi:hypothetical protein